MKKIIDGEHTINIPEAVKIVDAFSYSCGVACQLISGDGAVLYHQFSGENLCQEYRAIVSDIPYCEDLHICGAYQAERLGGRYIYLCPAGMGWISVPILIGGQMAGALVDGPVMIMELEDYIASTPMLQQSMSTKSLEQVTSILHRFPRRNPSDLSYMSLQLLADALYIGDSSRTLLEYQESEAQQQDIGEYIQQIKLRDASTRYPLEKERALIQAIKEGNEAEARRLLNELLGHIFFSTGGNFSVMRARSLELMALLSRAAADGGADLEQVLSLNQAFLSESDHLRSTDDLTVWLTQVIVKYTTLVFDRANIQRKDIIYAAINYMKKHLKDKVTLEDTARHAGFSAPYFSKIFKDELGVTFNTYLSRLRIDNSKSLLLSTSLSVGEVCAAVGYEDQSYFIKVFRKYAGVTPARFRKKQGRLDSSKERDPV